MSGESGVVFLQPALPHYRYDFFRRLADKLGDRVAVYYSASALEGRGDALNRAGWARQIGSIRPLLPGIEWQQGAVGIRVQRGDVLVLSGNPRSLSTLVLLLKGRLRGARIVWWSHLWSSSSRFHRYVLRLLLMRLADEVLFYTDREVEEYRGSRLGWRDRRPIHALNNGIDIAPVQAVRLPFRAAERARNLLFIGRLTAKAQVELLFAALADPALEGVVLELVGGGEEQAALAQRAEALGVSGRIVWHGGITEEAQIAAIANRCRLFVYPGGVGLSLIHAMAYGLPAIVHDDRHRHMPEIAAFSEGSTGASFPEGDAAGLAAAIAGLIDDTMRLDAMAAASIDIVERKYNTEQMAEVVAAICRAEPAA